MAWQPGPGVYVLDIIDDPRQQHYPTTQGQGPLYSVYTPHHLCHFKVSGSLVRAAIFVDAVISACGGPYVEAVTTAERVRVAGRVLDGLGGYDSYGQAEAAAVTAGDLPLPMGVAEGCRLLLDVAKDEVLSYDDVQLPSGRLIDELRRRQGAIFV